MVSLARHGVRGARVRDDRAGVVLVGEYLTDEFVELEHVRAGDLHHAVDRGTDRSAADGSGHVVGVKSLKLTGARRTVSPSVEMSAIRHELEELSGVDDGVRDVGGLDQLFLRCLARK